MSRELGVCVIESGCIASRLSGWWKIQVQESLLNEKDRKDNEGMTGNAQGESCITS